MSKTSDELLDDLRKRFRHPYIFRAMGDPMKGSVGIYGHNIGTLPLYGIGETEEDAYQDMIDRDGRVYSWEITCATEDKARKLIKSSYEFPMHGVRDDNVITIGTSYIKYVHIVEAVKKARIGEVDIVLE